MSSGSCNFVGFILVLPGRGRIHSALLGSFGCALVVVGFIRVRWVNSCAGGSSGSFGIVWFILERPGSRTIQGVVVLVTGWCPPSQTPELPVLQGDLCDTIGTLLVTNPAKPFAGLCWKRDSSIWTMTPGPLIIRGASLFSSRQLQMSLKYWYACIALFRSTLAS